MEILATIEETEAIRHKNLFLFCMFHKIFFNDPNIHLQSFLSVKKYTEINKLNPKETLFEIHAID